MERSRKTLNASQKTPGINDRNANGASQPPRKSVAVSAEITIIPRYAARKNSANAIPESSTIWPATISDSPSTTSNGCRAVSAIPEIKKTPSIGNKGSQFHDSRFSPTGKKAALLRIHNVRQVQTARCEQHNHERKTHRDFIRDHLRGGAHRTQKRIFGIRRPAGQNHAIDANRRNRRDV